MPAPRRFRFHLRLGFDPDLDLQRSVHARFQQDSHLHPDRGLVCPLLVEVEVRVRVGRGEEEEG